MSIFGPLAISCRSRESSLAVSQNLPLSGPKFSDRHPLSIREHAYTILTFSGPLFGAIPKAPRANNAQAAFAVKSINSPILSKFVFFSKSDFLSALVELGSEIGLPGRWPVLGRCALSVARVAGGICPAKAVRSLTLSKHSLGFESRLRSPADSSMHDPLPSLRFAVPRFARQWMLAMSRALALPFAVVVIEHARHERLYSLTYSLPHSLTHSRWYDGMLVCWYDGLQG